jgi:hypothetical protein
VDRVRSSRRLYVDTDSASTYAFVRARVDNILKSVSVFRRIRAAIDCLRLLADKYSSGWNMPTFGLDDADPDGDRFFGCTGDSDTALFSLLRWRKMCFSSAHCWRVATLSVAQCASVRGHGIRHGAEHMRTSWVLSAVSNSDKVGRLRGRTDGGRK